MTNSTENDKKAENEEILPNYRIANWRHALNLSDDLEKEKPKYKKLILEEIEKNAMATYYRELCESFGWEVDMERFKCMEEKNKKCLIELEEKLDDAKTNFGDAEIRDAQIDIAKYYTKLSIKNKSIAEYEIAYEKAIGGGSKIDALLMLTRIAFFYNDIILIKKYIHLTKIELEKGGDWERRNKAKVYEGVQFILCRKFKDAALLFLECISTFTAMELLSFKSFVFYSVTLSMLTLDRVTLKTSIMESPEVMAVISEDSHLHDFLFSFYQCKYNSFLENLVTIANRVRKDRYMGRHYRYFIRNIRLRAYSQFLDPYKSVTLSSMATAFGVSEQFIEDEVSSFIACEKLSCKIDRVNGVIESNAPDLRNALYLQTIKNGDLLLNRIQKLSRVIDM